MTDKTGTTAIQRAIKLEDVPAEKYRGMVRRSWVGVVAALLLTVFLLGFSVVHFNRTGELSLWLIGGGVLCGFVCGQIASGQVMGGALRSLAEPVRAIRDALKGGAAE